MKIKNILATSAMSLVLIATSAKADSLVSADLTAAHHQFIKGDVAAMMTSLHRLFQDPKSSDLEKQNAYELLNKVYASRGRREIPVDWKLPTEVKKMKLSVRRRMGLDGATYRFGIGGLLEKENTIQQLQFIQYPDRVIVDKEKGIGIWEETSSSDGPEYFIRSEPTKEAPKEGLYLLNLVMTNGKTMNGWVIVNDMVSTDNTNIVVPSMGQVFNTQNPTLRWEDFKSPEYKPYERRTLSGLVLTRELNGAKEEERWEIWQRDPMKTETTVGVDPDGKGVSKLEKGAYILYVNYSERRKFGDIELCRDSATISPFYVK